MRARSRAGVVVTFLALAESGMIPAIQAGFYCDDPAISFKFRGDTVSMTALLSTTAFVPLLVVWLVEAWGRPSSDAATPTPTPAPALSPWSPARRRSDRGARRAALWYREFLLGLGLLLLVTDVAKVLVGEPRPHFLDTCRPDAARNCTALGYVAAFNCTNTEHSAWFVQDATKSFPSGHASISVYTALFLMWFLQRRFVTTAWLLVPWLQGACALWALVCSLTRITDHRHHWWDVLAGAALGVASAVFTVLTFCSGFKERPSSFLQNADTLAKEEGGVHENGRIGHPFRGARHQSVRRLLSSTSSCTGELTADEQEMQEAA